MDHASILYYCCSLFFFYILFKLQQLFKKRKKLTRNLRAQLKMTNLHSLSNTWRQLQGSGKYEERVQVLQSLGELLGKQGTSAKLVLETLGNPDEVKPSLVSSGVLPTMPGPAISSEPGQDNDNLESLYFIYYPQPDERKNYLYFKVGRNESIEKSEWKKE
ncbi:unnamed protein product [Cunninghamella blakesleeana]